jgi:predicted transcriptional regulator
MARPSQDVTDAELAVLQVLWDRGEATIRQIADVVYARGGASGFATVQKLLERLEAKGCVSRARGAGVQVFSAALGRDELIGRRLEAMAEKLCGGSLTPLLTHLVRADRLSPGDVEVLRGLIDRLGKPARPGKKGG